MADYRIDKKTGALIFKENNEKISYEDILKKLTELEKMCNKFEEYIKRFEELESKVMK